MAGAKAELAPNGTRRVGLNMSNFLLVSASRVPGGVPTGSEEIKANGTVARLIAKHGVAGVSVAAPAA